MKPGARLAAAVEVLDDITARHRPVAVALADWGKSHRFAGSGDRAAIGNIVYDVLRRRPALAAEMGAETSRALVLAAAPRAFALTPDAVAALADGSMHALSPLTVDERARLGGGVPADAPVDVRAAVPDWLVPSLQRAFGERLVAEGEALAQRAPVDLRANTLKADRDKVLKVFARHDAAPTQLSPLGVRIPAPDGPGRTPNVEADIAHGKGWFEVQDEASQIAALIAGAGPRLQVMDLCAGAGGKTLALAAQMQNTGQIYAYDRDRQQLRPIFERLKRAGVRNAQIMDAGDETALAALDDRFDVVLVDAPCTGTGTWRRRPDAKWRLKPQMLVDRIAEQRAVLERAAALVKPGGRLAYVTCSLLPEENFDQVQTFLERHPGFALLHIADAWTAAIGGVPPRSADGEAATLLLTPGTHETDGFFIALLVRRN